MSSDKVPVDWELQPTMSEEAKAMNRIADAIERQAEATILLARATAGEFDEQAAVPEPTPKGHGMGMG